MPLSAAAATTIASWRLMADNILRRRHRAKDMQSTVTGIDIVSLNDSRSKYIDSLTVLYVVSNTYIACSIQDAMNHTPDVIYLFKQST